MVHFTAKTLMEFDYVNWKGNKGHRQIETQKIYFGATEYHPEEQWLLVGLDLNKGQERTFAMKDMSNVKYY